MTKKRILFITFILSFIYVAAGTLVVIVSFPKFEIFGFNYNHPLWMPLAIITLPINILLFGLVMVDDSILSIFILQTIMFCLCWFTIYRLLIKRL